MIEYLVVTLPRAITQDHKKLAAWLNTLGQQRWRLSGSSLDAFQGALIFWRELVPPEEAA